MRPIRRVALVVAAVIGLASVTTACGDDPAPFAGARRAPAPALEATLPTVDGERFRFLAGDDEVLLVYFGFTFFAQLLLTARLYRLAEHGRLPGGWTLARGAAYREASSMSFPPSGVGRHP